MGHRAEIGLDMDGVQCRTDAVILRVVNAELGTQFRHQDVDEYHFVREKTLELTGDREQAERLDQLWFEPELLREVPPYRMRILALKMLELMGISARTATSRPPNSRAITKEWYRKHWNSMLTGGRLQMLADGKNVEDGDVHKRATIDIFQLPLFFEDSAETMRYFRTQGYTGGRLVDQPWNRGPENRDLDDSRVFGTIGILGTIWQACQAGELG